MSATITQSVLAKFVAAGLTDFDGSLGLWLGEIPENLNPPVIGFVHGGERPEYTFEREYTDSGTFTFTIFAVTVAETERLALLVMAAFDAFVKSPRQMDFTGGKVTSWEKTSYTISAEPTRSETAKQVGRADFQYAYTTQKSLPA